MTYYKIPEPDWGEMHKIIIDSNLLTEQSTTPQTLGVLMVKLMLDVLQRVWWPRIKHLESKIDLMAAELEIIKKKVQSNPY